MIIWKQEVRIKVYDKMLDILAERGALEDAFTEKYLRNTVAHAQVFRDAQALIDLPEGHRRLVFSAREGMLIYERFLLRGAIQELDAKAEDRVQALLAPTSAQPDEHLQTLSARIKDLEGVVLELIDKVNMLEQRPVVVVPATFTKHQAEPEPEQPKPPKVKRKRLVIVGVDGHQSHMWRKRLEEANKQREVPLNFALYSGKERSFGDYDYAFAITGQMAHKVYTPFKDEAKAAKPDCFKHISGGLTSVLEEFSKLIG